MAWIDEWLIAASPMSREDGAFNMPFLTLEHQTLIRAHLLKLLCHPS